MATDGRGDVYVADTDNNRVQKFDASGTFLTSWGGISSPFGVVTDTNGHVYVSDYNFGRIAKFDTSGAFLGASILISEDGGLIEYVSRMLGHADIRIHGGDVWALARACGQGGQPPLPKASGNNW